MIDFMGQLEVMQGAIPTKRDKELSLKTLKKKELQKIKSAYKRSRDQAKDFYEKTVQPAVMARQELYDCPPELYQRKFPVLAESTDWRSKDIKTTIDTILPSLIEVFTGSDDPCDIKGTNISDDETASKIQSIIKYQINKKNPYFQFLYHFIREGLITNEGVAKVYWHRDEERTEMKVMIEPDTVEAYMQQAMAGKIEIKKMEVIGNVAAVITYDQIDVKYNQPVLENMSPSELRFTPDGRTLQDCKFVAQRKIVKGDYLKRKEEEGTFANVEDAIRSPGNSDWTELDLKNNPGLNDITHLLHDGDNASKSVELYEAYMKVDYDEDGKLEELIVHAVGDTLLAVQENTYGSSPFFLFSPELDAYSAFSQASVSDNLEQMQDLKTALIRQVIIAVAKNNMPQRFVNADNVDVDSLINGDEVIPVEGNPADSVFIPPQIPISALTMDLVNYSQNEIESQSGSTRYNQGLDSNSLNKTATGITAIMGQADKKIRLLARIFAETAWVPIIKHLIRLNQRFLDPMQQFRLNDDMVSIAPGELDIDYDLTVNTGQGAGTKEAQMNYLLSIMNQLYPTLQMQGIVTENTWYKTACDLLELMGIRNAQSYILDPQSDEFKERQQQTQQAQQEKEQQELQLKQAEIEAKTAPKLSANYRDLPRDAKVQALEKYGGLKSSLQEVSNKENIDAIRGWRY